MVVVLPTEIFLSIAAYLNCQEQYALLRAIPCLARQFSYGRHLLANTDEDGNTLVHILALKGEAILLKSLFPDEDLETSLIPGNFITRQRQMLLTRCVNDDGATPLHLAAENGHVAIVEWIAKRPDVDLNRQDKSEYTCVERAARSGHAEIVSLLLYNPNLTVDWDSKQRPNPLCLAAEHGHETTVRVILERHGDRIGVNSRAAYGTAALTLAVLGGHDNIIQTLIQQKGVDVNAEDHLGNCTLHMAVRSENYGAVKSLLEHPGVNPNARDWYGHTPLQEAVCTANVSMVELLLAHPEIDVNIGSCKKTTPLIKAIQDNHEWAVGLLLKRPDIKPDNKDSWGMTALAWAAFLGRDRLAKKLLNREDVDPNARDEEGLTPLSLSMLFGWPDMAELLLKNPKVDINAEDNYGWTALAHAKKAPRSMSMPLMKMLLRHGATMTLYAEMIVLYNSLVDSDMALNLVESIIVGHDLEAYMVGRFGQERATQAINDGEEGVRSLLFRDTKVSRMRQEGIDGMLYMEG